MSIVRRAPVELTAGEEDDDGSSLAAYLNRTIKKGDTLTQRAGEIDVGGKKPSIILAQSEVDFTGNPCATA